MALDDLPPCTLGFDGTAAGWNDVRNLPDVFYNEAGLTRTDLGASARWTLAPSSGFPFFNLSRLSYQKLYGVIGVETFTMEARFRLPSIGASNPIRFTMEVGKSPWEHWNTYVLGETGVVTQMTFNEALARATITDTAYHTLTYTVAGDTGTLRLDGAVIGVVVENRDFGDHVAFRIENLSFTRSAAIEVDYVRWTAPSCGVPPDGVVDGAATVNTSGTLLAGPSGVTIAYRAETGGGTSALKIARYVGDAWQLETALTGTGPGAYRNAADLDRNGRVHAVYGQGGALYHATDASGTWTAALVPGMAPGNESMDLDDNDALHVTSAVHVVAPGRRYATNASGAWVSRQITTSSSTDAAIVAGGLAQPMLLCNRWQDRTIHVAQGPGFALQQIHQYGPDQGPPLALVVRAGTPIIAYGNHNGSTGVSLVRVEERVGGSWQRQTIFDFAAGHPIVDNLDLEVDAAGKRYVAMCDRARNVEIWSNASGAWRKTTGGRCGPSSIDALLLGGRLYVTYAAETTQRLTIRSWPTAAL